MTDDKKITVQRTIDASAKDLFDVLTLPSRHAEIDGSGFVRSDSKADRITANGQVFTMNMHGDHMGGDYQTDNHVTGYVDNKLVAWQTAPAGTEPKGWEWVWELEPQGQDSTLVTLTYDWSKVTDTQLLQKIHFPLVPQHDLEESLERLAGAVAGS
ncbi:polyketide cyclase [Arsenicicoccus sp. MKL-02]|uniref:Polyketide cyclase n=1 Tax=Arsenicicoccus cauae TaxID=2663847 RepID=A0A6I3IVR2_9MICO|nr:SRPBCC family protein [Arsenicicoccus cauae]MTB72559.1 polyketide cyclase [Arsenicicoccus cauae]